MTTNSPRAKQPQYLAKQVDDLVQRQRKKPVEKTGREAVVREKILGKTFDRLTVISQTGRFGGNVTAMCSCGKEWRGKRSQLLRGSVRSCGCLLAPVWAKHGSIVGRTFSRLTVLSEESLGKVKASCACGSLWSGSRYALISGKTGSCGCLKSEICRAVNKTHGQTVAGAGPNKLYRAWCAMRDRCYGTNKQNRSYVQKGIKVCDRWMNGCKEKTAFECFAEDIGPPPSPDHTIERINNKGNYEPGNVRWASWVEQANNTDRTRYIRANGLRMSVCEWARTLGVKPSALRARLKYGWPPSKCINTPINQKRSDAVSRRYRNS
jgi:hypothetical protein